MFKTGEQTSFQARDKAEMYEKEREKAKLRKKRPRAFCPKPFGGV